jgi:hypothetical protein
MSKYELFRPFFEAAKVKYLILIVNINFTLNDTIFTTEI